MGYSVYMQLSFFSRSHFGVAVSWFSHCIGSSSTTTRTRTSKAIPHWGFLVSELDGMSDGGYTCQRGRLRKVQQLVAPLDRYIPTILHTYLTSVNVPIFEYYGISL